MGFTTDDLNPLPISHQVFTNCSPAVHHFLPPAPTCDFPRALRSLHSTAGIRFGWITLCLLVFLSGFGFWVLAWVCAAPSPFSWVSCSFAFARSVLVLGHLSCPFALLPHLPLSGSSTYDSIPTLLSTTIITSFISYPQLQILQFINSSSIVIVNSPPLF